jgi:pSer/pThr/pTyr-binding forkhead associated (FHA) protein
MDKFATLTDSRTGEEFRLTKQTFVIGRHRSSDICIPLQDISRRHCKISRDENNVYHVQDLQSSHGTFLNEDPISAGVDARLESGYHIKLSKCNRHPGGAKVYIFRQPKEEVVIPEAGAGAPGADRGEVSLREKILLRNLVFRVGKREGMTLRIQKSGTDPSNFGQRVPLLRFGFKEIFFLSLRPWKPGEEILLKMVHPLLVPAISLTLRVRDVKPTRAFGCSVFKVECQVARFDTKNRDRFHKSVKPDGLLSYGFLRSAQESKNSSADSASGELS